MMVKRIMLITLVLLATILIGAVSASDVNDTVTAVEDTSQNDLSAVNEIAADNLKASEEFSSYESILTCNNDEDKLYMEVNEDNANASNLLSNSYMPKEYNEIQNYIDNANVGDTIILNGNYLMNSSDKQITVNKKLNFVGINDATITGSSNTRIVLIKCNGVTFSGITFKNGCINGMGGAIYSQSYSFSFEDCKFIDNEASRSGGAIYTESMTSSVSNCIFIGNTVNGYSNDGGGGALFGVTDVVNCTFIANTVTAYDFNGGAIYCKYNTKILNCNFINNSARYYGGAIYFNRGSGSCVNCSFVGNSAEYGGAVSGGSCVNCSFTGNSADGGGAVSGGSCVNCSFTGNSADGSGGAMSGGSAVNCSFVGNFADTCGGAMSGGSAVNCSFVNNSARRGGGTAYGGGAMSGGSALNCTFINNHDTYYGGAMLRGSAINCIFINNTADYNGGAVYDATIKNSVFRGNSAKNGGAIFECYVVNSLFENNFASVNGGAMFGIKANNCSFYNNRANEYGGAVYNANVSSNSIFNNNIANIGNDVFNVTFFAPVKNFYDLNQLINMNNDSYIYLNENYAFDFGFDSDLVGGIVISKEVIIFGNGFTIDGGNQARIFSVSSNDVIFKDIGFINGNSVDGGAIYFYNGGSCVNCSFVGNSASYSGGAVYGGSCVNCSFVGNSARYGGAILFDNGGSCVNSILINNHAGSNGGAVYGGSCVNCSFVGNSAEYYSGAIHSGHAVNCSFVGNYANTYGGAMSGGSCVNCSFVNCSSNSYGGAIYFYNGGSCVNCSFVGNSANKGGAIYSDKAETIIENCTFINNTATNGGAIYNIKNASNSIFIGNRADYGGAAYNCQNIVNSSFVGNSAISGGSTYNAMCSICNFTSNNVTEYGGAMYEGTANNCIFKSNSAGSGGAIYRGYVVNSLFENNFASVNGGAMFGMKATDCRFYNNRANEYGGAVYTGKVSIGSSFKNNLANFGTDTFNVTFFTIEQNFSDLNSLIHDNNESYIYLNDNYYYDFTCDSDLVGGIVINRSITICGNGFIIDGSNQARIFSVSSNNVIFKDIIFTNAKSSNGGAIYSSNYKVIIVNCSFVGNSASNGGAVSGGSCVNCSFVGNSADFGGAVSGGSCVNCSFVGNSANRYGGAMYGGSCVNCTFINNSAYDWYAGAIYFDNGGSCVNCSFVGNSANRYGGAIYFDNGGSCVNCTFINNNASGSFGDGGAICFDDDGSCVNCSFVNNSAGSDGGAINFNNRGSCVNCSFVGNSANSYGGAIYCRYRDNVVVGCSFVNNSAKYNDAAHYGSYVNCSFKGQDSNCLYGTSNVLDCLFDVYPTVNYHYTSYLIVNDLVMNVGEDRFLIVNLSDIRGPLTNRIVKFNFSGSEYEFNSSYGNVRLNMTDYLSEIGKYLFSFAYGGDSINNPISKNITVTVKSNSSLNVNGLSIIFGDEEYLVANLSDIRGQLVNRTVNFIINGKNYNGVTDLNGSVSLKVNDCLSDPGEYVVDVCFDGDELSNPSSKRVIVVSKYLPNLISDDLSIVLNDEGRLVVNLSNDLGPLTSKSVIFTINNSDIPVQTGLNGLARLNIGNYLADLGVYQVGLRYDGDDANYPVSKNVSVCINLYIGNLAVNKIGNYYNDTILLFNLTNSKNNREPISNASLEIAFSYGDNVYLTTDSNGIASYSVPFNPGNYDFTANVIDENVDVKTAYGNFEVKSLVGVIEITQNGTAYNNSDLLVKVYNPDTGEVYRKVRVNIDLNGNLAEIITNDEGIAVYPITLTTGTYHVLASITGEYTSFANCERDDIVIEKADAVVTFSNEIRFDYGGIGFTNVTVIGGKVLNMEVIGHPEVQPTLNGNKISVSGLNVGNYLLNITINPDALHNSVYKTLNIIVEKIASNVIFGDVVLNYNSSGITTLTLIGCDVSQDNISVIGHSEAIIKLNDKYEVTVSNLAAGTYILQVITTPDENHRSVIQTGKVTVNRIDSDVSFGDIEFSFGGVGTTTLTLEGCVVSSDNISIINHPEIRPILSGNVVTVIGLNAGTYILNIVTTPDSNHNPVSGTANVHVNRVDSSVSLSDIVFDWGDEGSTTLTLDGCDVFESGISVVDNDDAVISYDANKRKVTVSNLKAGTHVLKVDTVPDSNHVSVSKYGLITVNKVSAELNYANTISYDQGSIGSTELTVVGGSLDVSKMEVAGQKPRIALVGSNVVTISNLDVGDYYLVVSVVPDDNHTECTVNIPVTVTKGGSGGETVKYPATIEFGSPGGIEFYYGQSGSTSFSVSGGSIGTVEINGYPNAVKVAGNNIILSGLDVGTYNLIVKTNPDMYHYSVEKNLAVTVKTVPLKIQPSSVKSFQVNKGVWKVKVLDSQNKPVSNIKVTFTGSKFKTVTVVTNGNGEASYNIKGLSKGTHRIVSSVSHHGYSANPVTSSINIIKPKALKFKLKKNNPTKKATLISFQILDKKTKKGVNGVKVKVKIYTGKKYKSFTLKSKKVGKVKGIIGFTTNDFSAGKHKVVIEPVSLKYCGSGKTTMVIKKSAKKYPKKTFKV